MPLTYMSSANQYCASTGSVSPMQPTRQRNEISMGAHPYVLARVVGVLKYWNETGGPHLSPVDDSTKHAYLTIITVS